MGGEVLGQVFTFVAIFSIAVWYVVARQFAKWSGWKAIILQGGVIVVPQGFDAKDFGAVPGTFHKSTEILPTVGITIDVLKLH